MSLSLLTRRVAVPVCARAFTTSAPRADFGWSKLLTPFTHPSFIQRMKDIDVKFSSMKAEMYGVPAKVDAIDWNYWEKEIQNKALLAQIRKEYEAIKFDKVEGEDLSAINKKMEFALAKQENAAAISKEEIAKLKVDLAAAVERKKNIHTWEFDDYLANMPGLEEQLREEYMKGEFLPSDAQQRAATMDLGEMRKQVRLGTELVLPDGLPDRIGAFSYSETIKKNEDMLERMFGGLPAWEEQKVEMRLAAQKKRAIAEAAEAAAHHH